MAPPPVAISEVGHLLRGDNESAVQLRAGKARGRIMLRRSGGTADADDSKSSDRKVVRVRIPPSAPETQKQPL